jgi:hypothetical protein
MLKKQKSKEDLSSHVDAKAAPKKVNKVMFFSSSFLSYLLHFLHSDHVFSNLLLFQRTSVSLPIVRKATKNVGEENIGELPQRKSFLPNAAEDGSSEEGDEEAEEEPSGKRAGFAAAPAEKKLMVLSLIIH